MIKVSWAGGETLGDFMRREAPQNYSIDALRSSLLTSFLIVKPKVYVPSNQMIDSRQVVFVVQLSGRREVIRPITWRLAPTGAHIGVDVKQSAVESYIAQRRRSSIKKIFASSILTMVAGYYITQIGTNNLEKCPTDALDLIPAALQGYFNT